MIQSAAAILALGCAALVPLILGSVWFLAKAMTGGLDHWLA